MQEKRYQNEHDLRFLVRCTDPNFQKEEVKIFFERDTGDSHLNYRLFLTIEPWANVKNYVGDELTAFIEGLDFDEVRVVFDVNATDATPLSNEKSETYQRAEIKEFVTPADYVRNGNRIVMRRLEGNLSGAGQVVMYKHDRKGRAIFVRKYFIAVNDLYRVHIDYVIRRQPDGVNFTLHCKNRKARVALNVLANNNRLPCLAGDASLMRGEPVTVDFSMGEEQSFFFPYPYGLEKAFYALGFNKPQDSEFYLLNILYDEKFPKLRPIDGRAPVHVCPYCGKKMSERRSLAAYEQNAICCHSQDAKNVLPIIVDESGKRLPRTVFCEKDLMAMEGSNNLVFQENFRRLLPVEFFDHEAYRIMLLGSVRAGKTTYLSRFFGLINNGQQTSMTLRHLSNTIIKLGISVSPANIPAVTATAPGTYVRSGTQYPANASFYRQRAIDYSTGSFPGATPSGADCARFPFIVETRCLRNNRQAYVSFYDIPGEDAKTRMAAPLAEGERGAVFLFINAIKDSAGNMAVINQLHAANLPRNTPIAVILAKFDLVEDKFSANAHVRRNDYFELANMPYEAGIGREILASSEEVKSYLNNEAMILDIESRFDNVSYFALSSFTEPTSIHKDPSAFNDPGSLGFDNGTKRIELPLYWALKQFGLLD